MIQVKRDSKEWTEFSHKYELNSKKQKKKLNERMLWDLLFALKLNKKECKMNY